LREPGAYLNGNILIHFAVCG